MNALGPEVVRLCDGDQAEQSEDCGPHQEPESLRIAPIPRAASAEPAFGRVGRHSAAARGALLLKSLHGEHDPFLRSQTGPATLKGERVVAV